MYILHTSRTAAAGLVNEGSPGFLPVWSCGNVSMEDFTTPYRILARSNVKAKIQPGVEAIVCVCMHGPGGLVIVIQKSSYIA